MPISSRQLATRLVLAGTVLLTFSGCFKVASQNTPAPTAAQSTDKKQPEDLPFESDSKLAPTEPPKVDPPTYPPPTE